ncbi:MAG: GNAT family N-acetyltransferase [Oscillospiraceae bacterium]
MNIEWLTANDQVSGCYEVRKKVFIEEQGFENEFDEIDNIALHLCLRNEDETVATARIFKCDGGVFHAGRICVLKKYRKNHLGALIMSEICKKVSSLGGNEVYLSAQVKAKPFYEKQGFVAKGEIYMDENCPHIDMYKSL